MEPTKQSALFHRGKLGQHRNAYLFGVISVDPVLQPQNFRVTVKQVRRENGIRRPLATRRSYNEETFCVRPICRSCSPIQVRIAERRLSLLPQTAGPRGTVRTQMSQPGGEDRHVTTKGGITIYCKDWRKGQPIVFSHGWPLSADDWEAQMLFFLHQAIA